VHGGNVSDVHGTGELLTSIGRLTGLLAAYAALLQVVLLARIRWLERLVGFDRLTVWHRWNGHACLDLVIAHVVLTVWGYALMDRISLPKEVSTMLGGGVYPGMITAQIPTGNELAYDHLAADYWRALYIATLALIVGFRVLAPLMQSFRHRLRVAEVVHEGPGVVSVHVTGRALDGLNARAGQFFLWRFLDRKRWWSSHPFSLSAAPDGRSLRITVKSLGDFTSRLDGLAPGTRVIAEGPFGVFTESARKPEKVLLVAGGIGITPIRALMEDMHGEVVVIYRVADESDIVFREELEWLAHERGLILHFVVDDHATRTGRRLLSPRHLRELVPDISDRQVYVCGPPAMTAALERNVRRADVPARFIHTEKFAL
jgi:predicted ferric reductase